MRLDRVKAKSGCDGNLMWKLHQWIREVRFSEVGFVKKLPKEDEGFDLIHVAEDDESRMVFVSLWNSDNPNTTKWSSGQVDYRGGLYVD